MQEYLTIQQPTEGLYKEKGSKFIAYAKHIESIDEAKDMVAALRKEHHKARHVCFAYRLGQKAEIYRGADDGEPAGTAGKPILRCLEVKNLSNCIIVVVRYYGGRPLGTGGLSRAYRTASEDALSKADFTEL